MDIVSVYNESKKAIDRARKGEGPTLIECKTYRFMGHSRFEKAAYRTKEELEDWKKKDPINIFKDYLLNKLKIDEQDIKAVDKEVDSEIEDAVAYAEKIPDPEPDDYKNYIYA